MKKRILSILLTLCMVLCLVPTTAFAAGGAKAILPGTSAQSILKIDKSRLSFAGHEWWVIGQKTDKSNNAPIITLLAVNNDFGDVPFRTGSAVPFENARRYSEDNGYYANNPSDMSQWRKPNEYAGSTLQQKMVSLAEAIPEKEQAVIRPKDITEGITGQEVEAQKLWAFSQEDSIYLYRNSCKYAAQWWTRSSNEVYGYGSWTIHPDGRSGSALNVDYDAAVRPAMEMDLSSVLFISAAEHGKVADLTTPIAEYAGDEWKLTLHDSDRDDFTAKTVLVNGSVLEVEYKNAKVGDNEYISAVIKDADGSISRYTRVVQLDGTTNGTRGRAAIDLTGIDMTGKTLCVFNEQFNGDHKTDYAGALREVKLTDEIDEQFTLTPGGRYYFDLSAMDIPGTVNSDLPDKTLHYVPFTYVGTVDAYSMENEADNDTTSYEHSLFIANYNVTHTVSWDALNTAGLLFGKDYAGGGVNYTLRAPSAGLHYSYDQNVGGTPRNNEWDVILDKAKQGNNDNTNGYVKNWQDIYSWGQDKSSASSPSGRSLRGYRSSRHWYTESATRADATFGFRPVLEVPNSDTLDSGGLKAVTLDLGGGKLGGSSDAIHIIVKNGSAFTAPASDGLTRPDGNTGSYFMWLDGNGKSYEPGDSVPADVTELTVQWTAPTYTVTLHANGGTINNGNVTEYTYGVGATLPTDVTRTGYTFKGWYDNESLTGSPVTAIGGTETGNKEYWAKWEINQYTITVKPENGKADITITQDYGTPITAPADPTREGYTFIGWDREIPTTMPAENMTLKARWKDIEKPTGEIIIGTNKWHSFLNKLTLGLFFKDTQEVTINASDNSGTVFISYLVTDRDISETELGSLVYRAYEEPFRIDPNGEYIVYAMLVDESLNITYLRSDRVTLDNVQPMISGIEDGKTYCEAQTVTINEKYIETVTVNGTAVELDENNSFVLSPADGEQKIVVTDKAGNTAEMTVTVNDGHTYGEWVSNGDGTHTRQCTVDGCNGLETKDCSGGKATCAEKAVCEVCGKAYGELDPKNHTDLKYIPAKAATEDAEGNIEYWYCSGCGKYYSDKDGTKEIKKANTVTAKLPKSPQTGDNSNLMLWIALLFVSGGVVTGTTVISKKKKHSAE